MSPALKLVLLVFVTSFMLQSGLASPPGSLARAVARAREIVAAALLMLVVGPVVALLVGRAFGLDGPAAAALLLLSVVGVVPLAPRAAKQARGDVPLAIVVMLTLSSIAALTATPAARAVLSAWGFRALVGIEPASFLLMLVVLQVLPLAAGLALRARAERVPWLARTVAAINGVAFSLVALVVVAPRLGDITALGLRGAAAGVVFASVLAGLGWAMGGPTSTGRRTLAAIANMPNVALALALVASAYAPPVYSVALLAMFLVRLATGLVIQVAFARLAGPVAPEAYRPPADAQSAE